MVRTIAKKQEGAPSGRSFGFDEQNAVGDWGQRDVVAHLRATGRTVTDLSKDRVFQHRDIDLLVDDWWCEVKTDLHAARSFFVEVQVGEKPGYAFKSRADYFIYYFPRSRLLYWIPVPALLWWMYDHHEELVERVVHSRRGSRSTWKAVGVLVPIAKLKAEGLVAEFHVGDDEVLAG